MTDGVPTPASWRAAAAATLAGGTLLGFRAASGSGARLAVLGGMGAALAATVPIAIASRRPPIAVRGGGEIPAAPDGESATTFTIVAAARDEAAVLPRLVEDVAAQDHRTPDGRPLFELVLIDDRSIDGTAQAALRTASATGIGDVTRIVRRGGDVPDGKGAALTAMDPGEYRGDVVVVLDADARIGPAFLSTLAHYAAHGARAITARRRILDAESSWLAGAQADEQTLDGELQRGRWALGGLSEFRGNGIVVARDLLIEVGGWRSEALTEDLDLSSRVATARGHGVAWALDAEVWEEPVRTWAALWRQRVRWAEGALRRVLEHGPKVITSPHLPWPARLDFAAYTGQLLAPPLIVGAVGGALARGRLGTALALLAAYGSVTGGLAWDSLRWERPMPTGLRVRRAVRETVFASVWLGAVPAALWRIAVRRGPVVYDKMEHLGGVAEQPAAAGSIAVVR